MEAGSADGAGGISWAHGVRYDPIAAAAAYCWTSTIYQRRPLSSNDPSTSTNNYYVRTAHRYAESTRGIDMRPAYTRFLPRLAPGARILDAGCGSGRDSRAFREAGFQVTATDASPELARAAEAWAGIPVEVRRHEDTEEREKPMTASGAQPRFSMSRAPNSRMSSAAMPAHSCPAASST